MSSEAAYYRLAFRIAGNFTGTIGLPAVVGAFVGKLLDSNFATAPRYLALCLITAFLLSARAIYRKAKGYAKEYEAVTEKKTV